MLRFVLICLLTLAACADGVKQNVRFAPGKDSATLNGAVIRGERDLYFLGAKSGQTMTVGISALEENAAFTVFRPSGRPLSEEDAIKWQGKLPETGIYRVEVGGTRGNATYKVTFTIR